MVLRLDAGESPDRRFHASSDPSSGGRKADLGGRKCDFKASALVYRNQPIA
jgi:hypothetical protein